MIRAGITGGIGSGKSTVCNIWSELGACVIKADDVAKQLMVNDDEVKTKLVDTFGTATFLEDGTLNRAYLAKEAFEKNRVAELNAIVHPKVPKATQQMAKRAKAEGAKVFVYEAALLLENIGAHNFDYLILVLSDKQKRIQRVMQRDGSSAEEITHRIAQQQDFEEAVGRVDFVLYNNGSKQQLKEKAELLFRKFV